ncbi:uncharacterized protein PV09_07820 [Verruconis gallopava]|uniref:Heterokaryon incompatibility domain-containing protein n=1 Tax=Verruconis gallopava TaxID=253628 RepID=A0A0D2A2N6_9PEZI|nr:uncharacterized protein PV09_07820 [Verruconis gallopava]KIW00625.1 hypothetical protein PV09_07820 [Verruconis gallopava]
MSSIQGSTSRTFVYKPLLRGEIRLLSLRIPAAVDEGLDKNPRVELGLQHFHQNRAPDYLALSYVWGNGSRPEIRIVVNGRDHAVTENLYDAVVQIRRHGRAWLRLLERYNNKTPASSSSPSSSLLVYLWIDAICLNQCDQDEKAAEVPRMGSIFGNAVTVVVWLGRRPREWDADDMRDLFDQFFGHFASSPFIQEVFQTARCAARADESGDTARRFARLGYAALGLINLPWFQRVWVIQEIVLARHDPIALLGDDVFLLRDMLEIVRADLVNDVEGDMDQVFWIVSQALRTVVWYFFPGPHWKWRYSPQASMAEQLEWLILQKGEKRCSLSHDHIYGLLGLLDLTDMPAHLLPNYARPHNEVYRDYSIYIYQRTGSLALLENSNRDISIPGVPSWVSSFQPVLGMLTNLMPKHRQISVLFPTSDKMVVEGVVVGKIVNATSPSIALSDANVIEPRFSEMVNILNQSDRILNVSRGTRWSQFVVQHERLAGTESDARTPDDFRPLFHDEHADLKRNAVARSMGVALINFGVLLTEHGDVFLFWPPSRDITTKESHIVVALKGSLLYSIFRNCGSGEYMLVGQAQRLETFSAALPEPQDFGERFFQDHAVQYFTIV